MTQPDYQEPVCGQQDNMIFRAFKTTTEPYDYLDWDGDELLVFLKGKIVERYTLADLTDIIPDFPTE